MTRFTATNTTEGIVTAPRDAVWELLRDPAAVTRLTPFVRRIDVEGDLWIWHMSGMPGLPVGFAPSFTERMHFTEKSRIDYEHAPRGKSELAAVAGSYTLEDHPQGTKLGINLEICVSLPLPKLAGPVVQRAFAQVFDLMGDRFAARLLEELDAEQLPV